MTAVLREGIRNNSESGQAIVLISDGAHNVDSVDSVLSAAYEAKSLDIPIYTVTLGKQVGAQNLSLAARSPRMIAFADHPLSLKIRVNIPVVTYQPVGSGQAIVVEGAGMWRWAFLAPQFADKKRSTRRFGSRLFRRSSRNRIRCWAKALRFDLIGQRF